MARVENLYLFAGTNEWEKNEALQKLRKRLFPEGPSSMACDTFEGRSKEFSPERVLSDLVTVPFESHGRFVCIKDIDKTPLPFQARLLEIVTHLPKETTCLLETKEMDLRGHFLEKVAFLAKVSTFRELKESEVSAWVDRRATFYGKRISLAARELLLEKVGENLSRLDKALETVSTYLGENSSIEEQSVEALLGVSLTHTSFELARSIASREPLKALTIFSRLLQERENLQEILGTVGWYLRRMVRAKELLGEGISPDEVGRTLRIRWELREDFFASLSRFEHSELEKGLRRLLTVDRHVKTGAREGRGEAERLVLELCR
ncbi:MAG: DNA polymerase III subunit delta [Candidatus Omnitrophica bacterium]|nr:DNA polymerase III subunit delta [Candidatus Omnitrophota bacterium]